MPRVRELRNDDANYSKVVTTRSKTRIKSKIDLSSSPVLKKGKTRAAPQTKPIAPKKQHKKEDTDKDECNENLTQNRNNKIGKNHINKVRVTDKKEKIEVKPKQNKRIIIVDESSKDSVDDNEYESEDDYEPDTSDEEEYRLRSHFW